VTCYGSLFHTRAAATVETRRSLTVESSVRPANSTDDVADADEPPSSLVRVYPLQNSAQLLCQLLLWLNDAHRMPFKDFTAASRFSQSHRFFFTSDKVGGICFRPHARARMSVCLSVCVQDYSKTRAWIWMKCCVSTDVGTWTNSLAFEPVPNHSPDAGTGFLPPISYRLRNFASLPIVWRISLNLISLNYLH